MKVNSVEFARVVEDIVRQIPEGKVLTYGDVAAYAGFPAHARLVGRILGDMGFGSPTPCHRVVNSAGRCAPHWHQQRLLLEKEGVRFNACGNVDLKLHRWMSDV